MDTIPETQRDGEFSQQQQKAADNEPTVGVVGKILGLNLRATGLYAGACVSAVSVFWCLADGLPARDSSAFVLSLLMTFVAGNFTHAVTNHGRLNDALKDKEYYRKELARKAEAKEQLEEALLSKRSSSAKGK